MLLADIVATSQAVAATRSRKAKVAALAETLAQAGDEAETVTSYLAGSLRQRRTGVGWRSVGSLPEPSDAASLTVGQVHDAFEHIAGLSGAGSQKARAAALADLFARATAEEQAWLRQAVSGAVLQGASDVAGPGGPRGGGRRAAGRRAARRDDGRLDRDGAHGRAVRVRGASSRRSCSRSAARSCRCSRRRRRRSPRRW